MGRKRCQKKKDGKKINKIPASNKWKDWKGKKLKNSKNEGGNFGDRKKSEIIE
jgi:hypothetical protein